jgi:hypothetical protein
MEYVFLREDNRTGLHVQHREVALFRWGRIRSGLLHHFNNTYIILFNTVRRGREESVELVGLFVFVQHLNVCLGFSQSVF